MTRKTRAALALLLFLALLTGYAVLVAWVFHLDLQPDQQAVLEALAMPRLQLLAGLGILGLALFGGLFGLGWSAYAGGAARMVESLQVMLDANRELRVPETGPPEIRALAAAVNRLAERHAELARDMEARILRARVSVEEEKNRLAALMSELSLGVLVCNTDGRILLYNERARQALTAAEADGAPIGLGRSVFGVIDRNLVTHALDAFRVRMDKDSGDLIVHLVATTRGGQLLRLQIAPVLTTETHAAAPHAAGEDRLSRYALMSISGFVMTVENVTRSFEREAGRDRLLELLTEGTRAQLGNIRAAVESLLAYPDCESEQRERFVRVIGEEAKSLSDNLDRVMSEHAGALKNRWPLEDMHGGDLVAAARRRIESRLGLRTEVEAIDDAVWLRCDSYTLVRALGYLAGRLRDEYGVAGVRFGLAAEGRLAVLDMSWDEALVSTQTLFEWEAEPLLAGGEDSPLTLRDIAERHGAEIAYLVHKARFRAMFRLLLPLASPLQAPAAPIHYGESRPEFYDFDLFHRSGQSREFDGRPLAELAYTVIDTETTGLDPSGGDEIISIGAVRIVNGRLLRGETWSQLVDPLRPSAPTAASIHGITAEMLIGQPTIAEVLPRLHAFCEDTVLVGHNIAFDMRFLQLKEAQTGVRFTQPVLDTLLLSAVLHPQQRSHALEEIATRLGVPVTNRHTALGDALVTGEVFLRMIPLLAAQGIVTLRQAREAAEKSMYARVEY